MTQAIPVVESTPDEVKEKRNEDRQNQAKNAGLAAILATILAAILPAERAQWMPDESLVAQAEAGRKRLA
jgi:hypothetical protein